jgi:hypothetical protein|eukprot:COSAG01_NODE_4317_length_5137_cov_16.810441_2_plen_95_part_00
MPDAGAGQRWIDSSEAEITRPEPFGRDGRLNRGPDSRDQDRVTPQLRAAGPAPEGVDRRGPGSRRNFLGRGGGRLAPLALTNGKWSLRQQQGHR